MKIYKVSRMGDLVVDLNELGVSPDMNPENDPDKPTQDDGGDYPKVETPLGIGYVIDRDPRGWVHVWFSRTVQDRFREDEIEYL